MWINQTAALALNLSGWKQQQHDEILIENEEGNMIESAENQLISKTDLQKKMNWKIAGLKKRQRHLLKASG